MKYYKNEGRSRWFGNSLLNPTTLETFYLLGSRYQGRCVIVSNEYFMRKPRPWALLLLHAGNESAYTGRSLKPSQCFKKDL